SVHGGGHPVRYGTSRRNFVKAAVAATVVGAVTPGEAAEQMKPSNAPAPLSQPKRQQPSVQETISFPRLHTGRQLARISCPLGGIGTGGIGLGGRGNLQDWQIFNRPDYGNSLEYAFPAIWVKTGAAEPFAAVLERRLLPPYDLEQE